MANKTNALALVQNFNLMLDVPQEVDPDLAELMDDIGEDMPMEFKRIKIPGGGVNAFQVFGEDEDDSEMMKTIQGVIFYTHKSNAHWADSYGGAMSDSGDALPICSSDDGKIGFDRISGEMKGCDTCPYNQFTNGGTGRKECKNTRAVYMMLDNDPNPYLFYVPAGSLRAINTWLLKVAKRGMAYTSVVAKLSLVKATSRSGVAYSQLVIDTVGALSPEQAQATKAAREALKTAIQRRRAGWNSQADDVQTNPTDPSGYIPDDGEEAMPF